MELRISPSLPLLLEGWYTENKRNLPWRKDREPYHVWVSEIMLQQTRVEAVKEYYLRFLETLPTVSSLAACPDDKLYKLWEGLGYYSRVRNMKNAAQQIMEQHNGIFPSTYSEVIRLPGIGEYTAGAICSISYGLKTAAVDGNVMRVVSRLLNDATPIDNQAFKKEVKRALELIYPDDAGMFTQALMELGATLCGPNRKPDCPNCPCKQICESQKEGTAELLPQKSPKKAKREENLTVFILRCENRYALAKRQKKGLLTGLWEFPNVCGSLELVDTEVFLQTHGMEMTDISMILEKVHIFTHVKWNMRGYYITVNCTSPDFTWYTLKEVSESIALPTAFRQFWKEMEIEEF